MTVTQNEAETETLALDAAEPASKRKILSWAMWDWGTQPYSTVIVTFVFSVYLTSSAFGDINSTTQAVTIATAVAGILVALIAPALGQSSDRRGSVVRDLRYMTWGLAVLAGLLFFVKNEPRYFWFGVILYAIGFVLNEVAGVNSNALLDQVANSDNVGKVSGFGWGMGYLGGIVSLLLVNFAFIADDSWFGVTDAGGLNIRLAMLASAVWMVLFTLPIFRNLHDRPPRGGTPQNTHKTPVIGSVVYTYQELGHSIARLWRTSRQVVWFLIASVLFRDGLNAIFTVGGMVAAGTFGFSPGAVIIFGAFANVLAGVATMLFGLLDDKIGPKNVILIALFSLTVLALVIFFFHGLGPIIFWTAGLALTLFVGPAQAASRSYLARLIPDGKSGEIFGLYATTGRVVSFVATSMFAIMISVGKAVTGQANTQYWGVLGIAIVLLAGLLAMIPVREPEKVVAA